MFLIVSSFLVQCDNIWGDGKYEESQEGDQRLRGAPGRVGRRCVTEPTLRMALSKETVNVFIVLLESRSSSSSELLAPPTVTPGHMAGAQCHGNLTLLSFMETICGWFKAAGSSFRREWEGGHREEERKRKGRIHFLFRFIFFFFIWEL